MLPLGRDRLASRCRGRRSTAVPAVGARKPVIIFIVVDLPAPFGPRKPSTSPCGTVNDTSSTADQRAEIFDEMADLQHTLAPQERPLYQRPFTKDDGGGTATEPRMPQRRPGKALPGGKHHCKQPIVPELGRRAPGARRARSRRRQHPLDLGGDRRCRSA